MEKEKAKEAARKRKETKAFNSLLLVASASTRKQLLAERVKQLHLQGMSEVAIAKKLAMRLDEVHKVISKAFL